MSPTVRHDAPVDLDVVRGSRSGAAGTYAIALLSVALTVVVVLLACGLPLPTPGPLLLLAIPLALCMNRFLFFPNETGVTADAAVLFAAMVAFRGDATWLGPVCLALLVGPLDARHWGTRSFARMAYNSGSTALATAAGLAAFVPLTHLLGTAFTATLAGVAIAAVPYVVTESVLGVGLLVLLGEPARAAVRHQVPPTAIAVPLALAGAAAGLAALDVGWWCALLVLLPMPWVPELAFVVVPRRLRSASPTGLIAVIAVVLLVLGWGTHPWSTPAALTAIGLLTGLEGRRARWVPFPLLGAVAIVPAVVVPAADDRAIGLLLVVAGAASSSWWCRGTRRTSWGAAVWCLPLIAGAWCAADVWRELGAGGAVVFTAMTVVALGIGAAWGSPPWGSRVVGRWSALRLEPHRRIVLTALSVVALGATLAALLVADARPEAGLIAAWAAQVALASALISVRQWRFAPRRRAVEAAVLVVGSAVALVTVAGFVVVPIALWIAVHAPSVGAATSLGGVERSRVHE